MGLFHLRFDFGDQAVALAVDRILRFEEFATFFRAVLFEGSELLLKCKLGFE